MSDTPETPDVQPEATPESNPPAEAQTTEHMIPKSRFDDVNTRYKELQARLDDMEKATREAEEQRLIQQNKYQELYEMTKSELDKKQAMEDEVARYRASFENDLRAKLERVPEDKRHLVPEFDDPIKLSDWLTKAGDFLYEQPKPSAPKLDGGSGKGSTPDGKKLSAGQEHVSDIARQMGYRSSNTNILNMLRGVSNNHSISED